MYFQCVLLREFIKIVSYSFYLSLMQQTFIICNHICKPQFYQVAYESEAVLGIYIKEGFNLLTVYHRSNQLKEVRRDIIDPLANVFRF